MTNAIKLLQDLFNARYGRIPKVSGMQGGGSSRHYFRLYSEDISVIGVYSEDIQENTCFINLDKYFHSNGVSVPNIISSSPSNDAYLLEDLGDISLLSLLDGPIKIPLSSQALKGLVKIQSLPEKEWKDKVINKPFSDRLIKWDLNYFKYDFLKISGISFDEELLEDDFEKFTHEIQRVNSGLFGFMYRDFQSRNVMIKEDTPYFIDFQGGRVGPIVYDLVSFLWQAKALFSLEEKNKLTRLYIKETSAVRNIEESKLEEAVLPLALFRTLQVLGAYGLRGLVEKKQHFIESIPLAVNNLKMLRQLGALECYSYLKVIVESLEEKYLERKIHSSDKLTVTVTSFSYKKGYPVDMTGNGGGFIFDCRGLPNPGRYEQYKSLTGMDDPVKDFLVKKNEVKDFLNNAVKIVSHTVSNYIERGFESLQVGFGCTGGQHRSVYCADYFSRVLKSIYGNNINVTVCHREQNSDYSL